MPRTWRRGGAGDTPPMTMWDAPPAGLIAAALSTLGAALADAGLEPPLSLAGASPEVRGVRLDGPAGPAAYLVHHGDGLARGGKLILRDAPARDYEAYADLRPVPVPWQRAGTTTTFDLPPYRTSFILRPAT